jgi:hypothetical protein
MYGCEQAASRRLAQRSLQQAAQRYCTTKQTVPAKRGLHEERAAQLEMPVVKNISGNW